MKKSQQLLEKLQELRPSMAQQQLATEMHIHLLPNSCYQAMGNGKLAKSELVKAMVLSESVDMSRWKGDQEGIRRLLVHVLCLQANASSACKDHAESQRLLSLASTMADSEHPLLLGSIKWHQAQLLEHQQHWNEALIVAQEAALLAVDEQKLFCHQDHEPTTWILFYGKYLKDMFWLLKELCVRYLQVPQNGLLWAERSRMHFLMYQIYSKPVESALPEPDALDQCD